MKDYYEVLGIKKDACTEDIKYAYRKLSREAYSNEGAALFNQDAIIWGESLRSLKIAARVLLDPKQRALYDANPSEIHIVSRFARDLNNQERFYVKMGYPWDLHFTDEKVSKPDICAYAGKDVKLHLTITAQEAYRGVKIIPFLIDYTDCEKNDFEKDEIYKQYQEPETSWEKNTYSNKEQLIIQIPPYTTDTILLIRNNDKIDHLYKKYGYNKHPNVLHPNLFIHLTILQLNVKENI
jgi:DnaJ-class molecular chaperone